MIPRRFVAYVTIAPANLSPTRSLDRCSPRMHERFFESSMLLLMLLNPFFMSIYLLDLIEEMTWGVFARILVRAGLISAAVFMLFGWVGDSVFTDLLHVRFASFLLFGGVAFLVIGVRFLLVGTQALRELRGDPEHIAGSVAMPFMVGPGTVSASVLAGSRLPLPWALLSIVTAVVVCVISVIVLKGVHD